ncbi:MAG: DUF3368 domain-containing protein [Candidatus Neomarinimicrobiota bacterium]|nr:MAG: DUF3368 domain-containing protein [Candidatus Neomarinimicrobiota bacterium]RLI75936.1 MAG: DUF3368 domain-containing protein [Archaeoglobales archaeon]
MKVVSNSTCIIALLRVGRLTLLKDLFDRILIPEEVYREIYVNGKEGFVELEKVDLFEIKKIKNRRFFNLLRGLIDDGEAASIILAIEEDAGLIILDDKDARKIAEKLGLKVMGTAGILLLAKKKGIIEEIKPILEEMRMSGFYLSDSIIRIVLREAGEL